MASSAPGFGVFFDPSKSTSGQRFFASLYDALRSEARPLTERPAAVLFNVSAPIIELLKARLRRQRIVLRIDGLYFDRLSPQFLATFRRPLRGLFSLGLKYPWAHDFLAFWANLINQNYTAFARIMLAHRIVYQSRFSQVVHRRYFPGKPSEIIVNGASFVDPRSLSTRRPHDDDVRLVTIYDEWKPAKRIHDLVEFVRWARTERNASLRLAILGYTGKLPAGATPDLRSIIETSDYIETVPRFAHVDGDVRKALLNGDLYVTFSYRDPCPNTVVEAMAHGLPVIGCASGGLPDIVGDAGVLLPLDDFANGFFCDHRFGQSFPKLDFESVLSAIYAAVASDKAYRERVRRRFIDDLGMDVVAERYARVMRAVAA